MININNIGVVVELATNVLSNKKIHKFLCGTYSDGTIRSLIDSLNGEYKSPKERAKKKKAKHKAKKKKKHYIC